MTGRRITIAAASAFVLILAVAVGITFWPVTGMAEGQQAATATPAPSMTPIPTEPPTPDAVEPLTFAVVGDSISARTDRTGVDQSAGSWTQYAWGAGFEFVGTGWAQNGARLAEMKANLTAVNADVLVILAGTNDLNTGESIDERLEIVGQLAEQSKAPQIVISAVPPFDPLPQASTEWNAALKQYAAANEWTFVDPWSALRTSGGNYIAGYTADGVHPTPAAAALVGAAMRAEVLSAIGLGD